MPLFPTLAGYFTYSHLLYFLYIAAMLCCSEDVEYYDEDLFLACETPGHLPVARWYPFRCLVLSGLVISICNKIQYNKTLVFSVYILAVCMTTWSWAYKRWTSGFGLKNVVWQRWSHCLQYSPLNLWCVYVPLQSGVGKLPQELCCFSMSFWWKSWRGRPVKANKEPVPQNSFPVHGEGHALGPYDNDLGNDPIWAT
jgi:hypothetical protein